MKRRNWLAGALAIGVAGTTLMVSEGHDRARTAAHQARYVGAGTARLRVVRAGAGPAVVLLHGFGESLMSWRGVFDALAPHAEVVALDLPGFGLSGKPATGYATDTMAAAVVRAMDALRIDSAVIVGHSMGGAVALAVALGAPGRVRALVLVAPAVSAGAWGFTPPQGSGTDSWLRAAVAGYETLRPRFTAPHDPDWLIELPGDAAYSLADDEAYAISLGAVLREFDFDYLTRDRAARLRLPVRVIWGEFDQVVPLAVGRTLDTALADAELAVISRSLHRPHVERPEETARLIAAFLAGLE